MGPPTFVADAVGLLLAETAAATGHAFFRALAKTMTEVLGALDEKIVIEEGDGSNIAKHLPLKDFFTVSTGGTK